MQSSLSFSNVTRRIVIARDGEWVPSNGIIYAVFFACIITHGILASTANRFMNKLQTVAVALNLILIVATIIALPIGARNARNDGKFIFATLDNLTAWPKGWTFMLAWLSPIWTVGAFDSCVHMSEEAANAAKAVPLGILSSIGMCWGLGLVLLIVLAACMDPNPDNVLSSVFGQPVSAPTVTIFASRLLPVTNLHLCSSIDGPNLLRCPRKEGHAWLHVFPLHRTILDGRLDGCRRLTPGLGIFPGRCPAIFQVLPQDCEFLPFLAAFLLARLVLFANTGLSRRTSLLAIFLFTRSGDVSVSPS